jgi:hypothetical protein
MASIGHIGAELLQRERFSGIILRTYRRAKCCEKSALTVCNSGITLPTFGRAQPRDKSVHAATTTIRLQNPLMLTLVLPVDMGAFATSCQTCPL